MRIARIVQTRHRFPLKTPYQAAWDAEPRQALDVQLVWAETDDGMVGVGAGPFWEGFSAHADLFIGKDPLDLERHHRVIESLSFHYGPCWPLDLALWDLAGQIHGQPVWQLLGGQSGHLRAFASLGDTGSAETLPARAVDLVEEGFPALLMRLYDPNWQKDLETVAAVRAALPDTVLMADLGQGAPLPWQADRLRTTEETRALVQGLAHHGVFWAEEPLHRADYRGLKNLRGLAPIHVACGGSALQLHDIRNLAMREAMDVLRADTTRTGGLTGLFPILQKGAERGLMFSPRTWGPGAFANGVTLTANAHLAAASGICPCFEFPVDPPGFTPDKRDFLLAEPLIPDSEGWLALNDRPGFGLVFDQDALRDTQVTGDKPKRRRTRKKKASPAKDKPPVDEAQSSGPAPAGDTPAEQAEPAAAAQTADTASDQTDTPAPAETAS